MKKENIYIDFEDIIQIQGIDILNQYENIRNNKELYYLRNQNNDDDLMELFIQRSEKDIFKSLGIDYFKFKYESEKLTDFTYYILPLYLREYVNKIYINIPNNVSEVILNKIRKIVDYTDKLEFIMEKNILNFVMSHNITMFISNNILVIKQIIESGRNINIIKPLNGYDFKYKNNELVLKDESIYDMIIEKEFSFSTVSLINTKDKVSG